MPGQAFSSLNLCHNQNSSSMNKAKTLLLSTLLLHKWFPKLCCYGLENVYYQLYLFLTLRKKKKICSWIRKKIQEYFSPDDYKSATVQSRRLYCNSRGKRVLQAGDSAGNLWVKHFPAQVWRWSICWHLASQLCKPSYVQTAASLQARYDDFFKVQV